MTSNFFCLSLSSRYFQARMDARIVAFFLVLCLSTAYSLKKDGSNDNILDHLLETEPLKDAPEMVNSNSFLLSSSYISCTLSGLGFQLSLLWL